MKSDNDLEIENLIESLSPLERKVIPYLLLGFEQIQEKSEMDEVSVLKALKILEEKNVLTIKYNKMKILDLSINGIFYKKNHLPERNFIFYLEKNSPINFETAKKECKLSENEFKVSIGILKINNFIEIKNGKIILKSSKDEITKKSNEEMLIEKLPIEENKLTDEEKITFEKLKRRKDLVEIREINKISFNLLKIGKIIGGTIIGTNLLEEVTPEIIRGWNGSKKFRKYDINSKLKNIFGGKKHFVKESIEYGKKIWLEMGFEEMEGEKTVTSFWNFDALYTPQDHPARELHDTLFIKGKTGKLPEKKIYLKIKEAHENGVDNSKGLKYDWKEEEAIKVLLRTHTTIISVKTLSKLKIENPVDTKIFYPNPKISNRIRRNLGLKKDEKFILFFGQLNYQPNVEALKIIKKEVIPRLEKRGINYKIVICGKGDGKGLLKEFKHQNLIFKGFVDKIQDYINASDVVIAPLESGSGTRIKILEALACNKRVISTTIGAEGIKQNKFLEVEDDWQKFVEKI